MTNKRCVSAVAHLDIVHKMYKTNKKKMLWTQILSLVLIMLARLLLLQLCDVRLRDHKRSAFDKPVCELQILYVIFVNM